MQTKLKLNDNERCFACGPKNPEGLRLDWKLIGHSMSAEMIPEPKYQGWAGIVHGGILATLLDEAMTRLVCIVCGDAVTAEMTVRYIKPALIGQKLFVRGEIVSESKKLILVKGFIYQENALGAVIAKSTGKALKPL